MKLRIARKGSEYANQLNYSGDAARRCNVVARTMKLMRYQLCYCHAGTWALQRASFVRCWQGVWMSHARCSKGGTPWVKQDGLVAAQRATTKELAGKPSA